MDARTFINDAKSNNKYKEILKLVKLDKLAIYSRETIKKANELSNEKCEREKDRIELNVMYQALKRINFFDQLIDIHNHKYKIFNTKEMINPFIIGKDTLENEYINTQKDKYVEILAKKAQLQNRFSKLCKYGRNVIIEKTAKGKSKEECARIYENLIYKNILAQGKMEEFLDNGFKFYYKKELTSEEFEKLETTQMCSELIRKNKKEFNIDIKSAYIFSTYEHTHNYLAKEKANDITRIIEIYAKERKKGTPSFDIGIRNDPKILGQNGMGITINIPNYVCPFRMHCTKELVMDAEKENDIKLNKQFRQCPVEPTLPHKITSEQINKIQELSKHGLAYFKDKRIYSDETRRYVSQYLTNNLCIKHEYTKQEILGTIQEIKQKESELNKINQEIKEKRTKAKELQNNIRTLRGKIEEKLERN